MSKISIQKFFVILSVFNSNGGGPPSETGFGWAVRTQPSLMILCSAEREDTEVIKSCRCDYLPSPSADMMTLQIPYSISFLFFFH